MTVGDITKRGNALGFTREGYVVTGQYMRNARCWLISLGGDASPGIGVAIASLSKRLPTKDEAREYAATLIDEATTRRLAWWNVD